MPGTARIDSPGILHHVRVRDIERGNIFLNDGDRSDFLDRLKTACAGGVAKYWGG